MGPEPADARAIPSGPLNPGDVLGGRYRIDAVAGEGGMASVYAAHHLTLDQRVAVKVLVAEGAKDWTLKERFLREAQAAARLKTEHVASVLDAGILANGLPFLVMEYLDGCDLGELLKLEGPLPVVDVADYVLQALEGIAHAHAAGIVHRDVKPSNLYLAVRADKTNVVKVLDFGISKLSTDATEESKRLTGDTILGSPAYMSPEHARSARLADARSDVWSLGVCMYELLTGRIPFDGDGVGEMIAAILEANPARVEQLRPDVPAAMADVVHKCLQRDPEQRWGDAGQLARALAPFGSGRHAALVDRIEATLAHAEPPSGEVPGAMSVRQLVTIAPAAPPATPASGPVSSKLSFAQTQPGTTAAAAAAAPSAARRIWMAAIVAGVLFGALLALSRRGAHPAAAAAASAGAPAVDGVRPPRAPPATSASASPAPAIASGEPSARAEASPAEEPSAARPARRPRTRAPVAPPTSRPAILRSRD